MSMDADLIGKFITQQVIVKMANITKQYEKKIKNERKVEEIEFQDSHPQKNGTRGGGRASKKNKKSATQTNTKSRPPHKSASQSAQGRKSILWIPLRGRSQKAGDADSGTPGNGRGNIAACSKSGSSSTKQTSKTDGAKSRGRSKKSWVKTTASSRMSGDRENRMRSSS